VNHDDIEALKRHAAEYAAGRIEDGMVLGLGTGSTVRYLLEFIAARRAGGDWRSLIAIPTSHATEARARQLNIPVGNLDEHPEVDLTIDGADEVDPHFQLIKGLGGALLREKIVASCSKQFVIIVDSTKLVDRLGTRSPLPVEVEPFGSAAQLRFLRGLGMEAELRLESEGEPFITDGGHYIADCRVAGGIMDAHALERGLKARPGVLESGLFLGMTTSVIVAQRGGVREMTPPADAAPSA
jgi:ribose 5-phosphate isomerase A